MGPVVPGAPFSMSPDAALWVVDQLRAAEAQPWAEGLVPGLMFVLNSTMGDAEGNLLEHIPYPHYLVGWDRPEVIGAADGTWVEVLDRKLFLQPAVLERLRGKHLTLQPVKSTYASRLPAGQRHCVLRAGAEEKGIFKFLGE